MGLVFMGKAACGGEAEREAGAAPQTPGKGCNPLHPCCSFEGRRRRGREGGWGEAPYQDRPDRVLLCSSALGSGYFQVTRSCRYIGNSSMATRTCVMPSRSRTVTVLSSSVWKSTVTQKGVPISSWRR